MSHFTDILSVYISVLYLFTDILSVLYFIYGLLHMALDMVVDTLLLCLFSFL